ncbi:DMT family transporter [bacterium]|nr:DMT family transporter [bacterium]
MLTFQMRRNIQADLWLLFACLIWGTSFPLVKIALKQASPFLFLAFRFGLGTLLMTALVLTRREPFSVSHVSRGSVLGFFMFLGMILQTLGLKYTTASRSGFITGLAVVFVPLFSVILLQRFPVWNAWAGVSLAAAGVFLLTSPGSGGWNRGDTFTLLCAVSFAFQILMIEKLVRPGESFRMALIMMAVTALLSFVSSFLFNSRMLKVTASLVAILVYTSIFCTAFAFTIQTLWQPRTTAVAAGIIYTMEPVFAALFAFFILGDTLNGAAWFGCGCILLGMLISEVKQKPVFPSQPVS